MHKLPCLLFVNYTQTRIESTPTHAQLSLVSLLEAMHSVLWVAEAGAASREAGTLSSTVLLAPDIPHWP